MCWVRDRVREACEKFNVIQLNYDAAYWESDAQILLKEGVPVVKFPQQILHFAGPTRKFKLLIKDRKIRHNGNPVLAWQIGHTESFTDSNNNERPIKPKSHDVRKVDGVVATIMALDALDRGEANDTQSIYASQGVMYLGDE